MVYRFVRTRIFQVRDIAMPPASPGRNETRII